MYAAVLPLALTLGCSVGDADNFRVYHTPSVGWHWLRSVPDTSKGDYPPPLLELSQRQLIKS